MIYLLTKAAALVMARVLGNNGGSCLEWNFMFHVRRYRRFLASKSPLKKTPVKPDEQA